MQKDYDLSDRNGRYVPRFESSQTAYDQLVRNGHKSMTNFSKVTDKRSLVDTFLVVPTKPRRRAPGLGQNADDPAKRRDVADASHDPRRHQDYE